ncbi:MAG TPA: hypothetical protein VLX12_03355 [Syntrophorhabdales bacterium]|nr:hypothetical protein [Syntrophorhabdales bacterium]
MKNRTHALFPSLNVMQFNGSYPWGTDEMVANCPDSYNLLTVKVWRVK